MQLNIKGFAQMVASSYPALQRCTVGLFDQSGSLCLLVQDTSDKTLAMWNTGHKAKASVKPFVPIVEKLIAEFCNRWEIDCKRIGR